MTDAMLVQLRQLLMRHEGYKLKPYLDTTGRISIGIGRNLTDRGLFPTEVDQMFNNDVEYFFNFLSDKFPWFNELDTVRQIALIDMCFMGTKSFCSFTKMIAALEVKDYKTAADEIHKSLYADEVGQRACDIASIIRTGKLTA